jgi:hypothetical protein
MTPSPRGVFDGNQPLFTILGYKRLGPPGIGFGDHSTAFAVDAALIAINADIRRQGAQRDAVSLAIHRPAVVPQIGRGDADADNMIADRHQFAAGLIFQEAPFPESIG